LLRKSA